MTVAVGSVLLVMLTEVVTPQVAGLVASDGPATAQARLAVPVKSFDGASTTTVGAYAVRATSTSGSITGTTTVNITVTAFTPPPSRSAATAGCTSDRTPGSRYGRPNGWLGVFVGWGYLGPRLLSHECRHVYRYEIHGSIAAFLPSYLQQVATVGYHDAPFERDARPHNLNG